MLGFSIIARNYTDNQGGPTGITALNCASLMNLLVTGADGQLGRSFRKIAADYPDFNFLFTDLPEGDITDRRKIERLVADNDIGAIINCAAYTAVDRAESEPEAAMRVNAEGPAVLAKVARENGIKLVHISTDYVFSGTGSNPYKEDDIPEPTGVYGRTKLQGEEAIRAAGIDAVIVRTAWLYSEYGNNFVKTMLRLSSEGKNPNVVNDQFGTPTYATDLARAVMKLIGNGIEGFAIYHFTDAGEATWYEFAREIFTMSGSSCIVSPVTTGQYPSVAKRPAYSVLDKGKIMAAGVETPPWKDSLRECIGIIGKNNK